MSVAVPTTSSCRVHHGLLRYVVHVAGWMVTMGLASYGSVVHLAPPPCTWAGEKPRYWRREARHGLRACERYLRQRP